MTHSFESKTKKTKKKTIFLLLWNIYKSALKLGLVWKPWESFRSNQQPPTDNLRWKLTTRHMSRSRQNCTPPSRSSFGRRAKSLHAFSAAPPKSPTAKGTCGTCARMVVEALIKSQDKGGWGGDYEHVLLMAGICLVLKAFFLLRGARHVRGRASAGLKDACSTFTLSGL